MQQETYALTTSAKVEWFRMNVENVQQLSTQAHLLGTIHQ
jgi:hypothetical protein